MSNISRATQSTQESTQVRYSQELSILNEIARTLNASVDLPTILEQALEKVAELFGLETGWVLLLDETTGEPYPAAVQNLPKGLVREPERMHGGCYCLDAFCEGDLAGAANVEVVTCTRLQELAVAKGDTAGMRYHASIPLRVYTGKIHHKNSDAEFKHLGILNVVFPGWRRLTLDELELLYTVGDILSVAIERARLHANRLKAAQTEERNRLAREIHDTIAQDFAAIAFQLEAAEAMLLQAAEAENIQKAISVALDLTRKGLDETRRSVLDLRAAPLAGRTLAEALTVLAEEMSTRHAMTIAFENTSTTDTLPPAVEVGLYRVAQEALQNATRHAGAPRAGIYLRATPDNVWMRVEDSGAGFQFDDVSPTTRQDRFGLIGMRERVRLLGGVFQLETAPGEGVCITVTVPVHGRQSE